VAAARYSGARAGAGAARSLVDLSEPDLRRLVSPATFALADTWEKGGHVLAASTRIGEGGQPYLRGQVLGTWRRVDEVTVTVAGNIASVRCSCGTAGRDEICRHAATLVLHSIRAPTAFQLEVSSPFGRILSDDFDDEYFEDDGFDDEDEESPGGLVADDARSQLSRILMADHMTHLRQVARTRGIRISAKTKSELVAQLSVALSDPDNLRAALATLEPWEEALLVVGDLLTAADQARAHAISRAWSALSTGGWTATAGAPADLGKAMAGLDDLGLMMDHILPTGEVAKAVPLGVTVALGPRLDLLPPLDRAAVPAPAAAEAALGLAEVMRVIVDAARRREVGKTLTQGAAPAPEHVPAGWVREIVEESPDPSGGRARHGRVRQTIRLRAHPSPIVVSDRLTLVERTGASLALVDFAVLCLFAAGALVRTQIERALELVAVPDNLQEILARPAGERLRDLIEIWLELSNTLELQPLLRTAGTGEQAALEFRFTTDEYHWHSPGPAGVEGVRRLVARIIGRLVPAGDEGADWYSLDALLDCLWRLVPDLTASTGDSRSGYHAPGSKRFLDLRKREQWQQVWKPVVTAMLTGAMTWLGLVETSAGPEDTLIFRPRPAASILAGRPAAENPASSAASVTFGIDAAGELHATVPPGFPETGVHALFEAWGELTEASAAGLRYRLGLPGIHESLSQGVTGEQLLAAISRFAGGPLPAPVEGLVSRWVEAYGAVRIYDDLTLLEVNDDFLLRELLATSSLSQHVLHQLSPRLAAVDPTKVDDLLAELTRLGHSPRVLEGG
jgi:hypothetical protein